MMHDRLSRYLVPSLMGHLIALLVGTAVVGNLKLPAPIPESVCFVNVVQAPSQGMGASGEVSSPPLKTLPENSSPPKGIATKMALSPPPRPAAVPIMSPAIERIPSKRETPYLQPISPLPASSALGNTQTSSPSSGSVTGASEGGNGGAVGRKGVGVGGSGGKGGGHGSAGDAPPGEVGFGTATGISYAHQVKPTYPALAKRFYREGRVLLRLTVSESGALVKVDVIEDPGYGLATAAVEAVRKSRFNPARREGRPFIAQALLPVRFTLGGGE
jgi:protein TonB